MVGVLWTVRYYMFCLVRVSTSAAGVVAGRCISGSDREADLADDLSSGAQRVQDALRTLGVGCRVVELPQTTRSAAEAAQAIGCSVGQIAKSLVFRARHSGKPVLVVASGANRVNEAVLSSLVGEPVEKPDADYVRRKTGFAIGGIPPVGHAEELRTFIDEDLLPYDEIWAAAGTPNAVFRLTPADLVAMTKGSVVRIK